MSADKVKKDLEMLLPDVVKYFFFSSTALRLFEFECRLQKTNPFKCSKYFLSDGHGRVLVFLFFFFFFFFSFSLPPLLLSEVCA